MSQEELLQRLKNAVAFGDVGAARYAHRAYMHFVANESDMLDDQRDCDPECAP